ncbi:MAG: Fe-S cluster assembly protein SufD [Gemmatimonadota bacterium]
MSGTLTAPVIPSGARDHSAINLPTSKDEEWRFTPLGGLQAIAFESPAAPGYLGDADLTPYLFGHPEWATVIVVDGRVDLRASNFATLPAGVRLSSLAQAIADGDPVVAEHLKRHVTPADTPFAELNAALNVDGVCFYVPAGVTVATPVHVVHVATSAATGVTIAPRTLVLVESNATATLIESFVAVGPVGAYFTDACAELVLGANARLEHIRIQREGSDAQHIGFTQVDQQRDSHYRSFVLHLGGKLARHNLHAKLNASNIETLLYGLYLTSGDQVVDNHTAIFHNEPHCNSWEVYKGVLADSSRAVFNGKVFVEPVAQKTDAKQTNRNLLLSDSAKVDTKPQLEIFADDVKCTHGATVGRLDELQRYYLQTRGIAGQTAQALLIWAFVAEVMMEITLEPVRTALEVTVRDRLDRMIA